MYRGFKLNINDSIFDQFIKGPIPLPDYLKGNDTAYKFYYSKGKGLFDKQKRLIKGNLKQYVIGESGVIDGTKLQNDWFPQINCDIFISHSHKDENLAITLAGWLYDRFQLESFIDSRIWGFADDLLKIIDEEHCKNANKSYNYKLRNYSTSHVHMMLNMALMQMIDKTECLFFLNTPSSICLDDIKTCTLSPWIYSEIGISQMIKKNPPKRRIRKTFSKIEKAKINDSVDFKYDLDLSHLECINNGYLKQWANSKSQGEQALDALYEIIDRKRFGTGREINYIR